MDELKEHLKNLLDHGFICESHSPYGVPIYFLKKLVKQNVVYVLIIVI